MESREIKTALQETALYLRRYHGYQPEQKVQPKIQVGEDFQIQSVIAFEIPWQVSSIGRYGNRSGAGSADTGGGSVKSPQSSRAQW